MQDLFPDLFSYRIYCIIFVYMDISYGLKLNIQEHMVIELSEKQGSVCNAGIFIHLYLTYLPTFLGFFGDSYSSK